MSFFLEGGHLKAVNRIQKNPSFSKRSSSQLNWASTWYIPVLQVLSLTLTFNELESTQDRLWPWMEREYVLRPMGHSKNSWGLRGRFPYNSSFFPFPPFVLYSIQQTHELDDATIDLSGNTCGIDKIKDIEVVFCISVKHALILLYWDGFVIHTHYSKTESCLGWIKSDEVKCFKF